MYKCIVCGKDIVEPQQDWLWLRDDRVIGQGLRGLHQACAKASPPKCNKECGAVMHMTGGYHRTDCDLYRIETLLPESDPKDEMGENVYNDVEQLRDIWCGRLTYDNDEEWLDNVESVIQSLSKRAGIAFASVLPAKKREDLNG